MEKPRQARRHFLRALILAGVALPLWRYLTPRPAMVESVLRVAWEKIPAEGALVFRQSRVAVMRSGDDVYALSLVCTHLGCIVSVSPTELSCPCHGSSFSLAGEVLRGPATRNLDRLEVRREGDDVVVFS